MGAKRQVERLIRRGVGVREQAWWWAADAEPDGLRAEVTGWVRAAMGEMRRPYGLDHVALALACRDARGRVLCTNSFGVVRPSLFYGPEGEDRIRAFFDDAQAAAGAGRREVVVALLSLGDIAYELRAA